MHATSQIRFAVLCALLLAHPLTYAWGRTVGGLFPDSLSYLTLAGTLLHDGQLLLRGIGHVDIAQVLPPLYPLLIALGSLLVGDAVLVSQWISGFALLLATIPLYLWIERASGPALAAAAVLTVQWQPGYRLFGTSTMTEGLFFLLLATLGYLASRTLAEPRQRLLPYLMLGLLAALLVLARQVGWFVLPTLLVFMILCRPAGGFRPLAVGVAAVVTTFTIVVGAYAAVLAAQDGSLPWVQSIRMNHYVVRSEDPPESARTGPVNGNYEALYAQRRELRRLTPDATEMMGYLVHEPAVGSRPAAALASPGSWPGQLRDNLGHALKLLGPMTATMALLGFMLALLPAPAGVRPYRIALPVMLGGYLLVLSATTGIISRYVDVMTPLLLGLAFLGVHIPAERLAPRATRDPKAATAIAAGAALAIVMSVPGPLWENGWHPKIGEQYNPLRECRRWVTPGTGVFSLHPMEAYLVGGTTRFIPNDGLDRIAEYARRTGTGWLVFRQSQLTTDEALVYGHAPWLSDLDQLIKNPNFTPRCASDDATAVLFEIRGAR